MPLTTLIERLFGKSEKSAKTVAKDRLRLVLMHDRADIPRRCSRRCAPS
jgi:septum formation topological specificity factor MinE